MSTTYILNVSNRRAHTFENWPSVNIIQKPYQYSQSMSVSTSTGGKTYAAQAGGYHVPPFPPHQSHP